MFSKPSASKVAKKRKHVTLSIKQKLDIIKRLEKGENRNKLMEEYNIGSSTIYDIKKNKDQLVKFASQTTSAKDIESRQTLKKPKLDELDDILFKWFTAKRSEGKPVTGPMIMEKGKQFREDLGIAATDCVFSDGWLHRFKARHGIRKLDVAGELRSADQEAATEYKEIFENLVKDNEFSACQLYNADETGLLWRCLPNSTLAAGDEKCAKGFKKNKDRLTVLFCGNASGDHMLTPFVIGKAKKPRALKNCNNLPVVYGNQTNAWMNGVLFSDWFFHHFVPSVKDNLKKRGLSENSKVVLLLDNCTAHPPASELISGNIFATYLPANVTSLLQPMDQGVIQNFKSYYRASFIQNLVNSDCMVTEFQKSFNIKDAIFGIALAWSKVKPTTLQKSWRKLWPKAYEEEEESTVMVHNEAVLDLVTNCSRDEIRELPQEEVLDWIDIDCEEPVAEEITDELLIESVLGPQSELQPVDNDSDDEEGADDNPTPPPTWSEANSAIDTFIRFAECSNSYSASELMYNKK